MGEAKKKTKNQVEVEHVIFVRDAFVRDHGKTYIATARGEKASSTAGREEAAKRLAQKLMGARPYTFAQCFKNNDRAYMVLAQSGR